MQRWLAELGTVHLLFWPGLQYNAICARHCDPPINVFLIDNNKCHMTWPLKISTHSRTSLLNCFCRLPRNSPIICLLRPFLWSRKWATPMGVSGMKPREIRNWRPLSGLLTEKKKEEEKLDIKIHFIWVNIIQYTNPSHFMPSHIKERG